jgi:hypothetical protein
MMQITVICDPASRHHPRKQLVLAVYVLCQGPSRAGLAWFPPCNRLDIVRGDGLVLRPVLCPSLSWAEKRRHRLC